MQDNRRMSDGQRLCLTVASAAALAVVAQSVCIAWFGEPSGGWFMYSPNGAVTFSGSDRTATAAKQAGVWLVAIAVWLGIAWRIFKRSSSSSVQ